MAVIKMNNRQLNVMDMEECFEHFVRICKSKNLSDATIKNYDVQFRKFNMWYNGNPEGITDDTIMDYVEHLKEQVKPVSINTSLRHLKAIFNFWAGQGYMQPVKIHFLKYQEELKEVYTDEELKELLKKPNMKKCNFTEFRTWAIINFLSGTGCRVQTLTNLLIRDINFKEGLIYYRHTKNKKAQFVPLSPQLQLILTDYLHVRKGKPDEYLFPSENNTKMLESTVTHTIKDYCRRRGLREGNCHLFRHTFTKNWIIEGGDSIRLQKVLGHQSLKMVEHYSNIYKADLKVGFDTFNLLDKHSTQKIRV